MSVDINDYSAVANAIASTIAAAGKPLTDDQRLLMAGALGVWLEKARIEGILQERRRVNQEDNDWGSSGRATHNIRP